jgi:hypothetical protein
MNKGIAVTIRKVHSGYEPRSIEQVARECLAEAHNDPERAIALAGRHARGAKLRAVHMRIATVLLQKEA